MMTSPNDFPLPPLFVCFFVGIFLIEPKISSYPFQKYIDHFATVGDIGYLRTQN